MAHGCKNVKHTSTRLLSAQGYETKRKQTQHTACPERRAEIVLATGCRRAVGQQAKKRYIVRQLTLAFSCSYTFMDIMGVCK